MDPLNQVDVMHLQGSRSSVLDLSMSCRPSPLKTNAVKALNLVKKSSWRGITSGSNKKKMSQRRSDRYVTQPCNPNAPDHQESASQRRGSRASGVSSRDPCSLPLPQINGQSSVHVLVDDDEDCRVEMDDVWMQTKKLCKKTDSSTLGDRMAHNGLETHRQHIVNSCAETYLSDTVSVMSQTKGSSHLPQDTNAAAYRRLSTRSAVNQTAVQTLESQCTSAKETSPCSVQSISSDDDSDIVEVPVTNSKCKTPPNCRFEIRRVIINDMHTNGRNSSTSQEVDSDGETLNSPKNVNNVPVLDGPDFKAQDVKTGSKSKSLLSWMESIMIPIVPQDSDQDTNQAFPKLFPSTSENTSILRSPPSGALSLTSRQARKTPATNSMKRSKPRPKQKKPPVSSGGKSAASTPKKRRRKPCFSGTTSMFSPHEPEIKLKYANLKEDKKDAKGDEFAPYIHMEFSSCTIVNFRDEDDFASKKGQQPTVCGVIPTTSCLQLGRVGTDDRFHVRNICSLCGRTANCEGLGDLHGPYYPSGVRPVCKNNSSPPAQRQEGSDLDSVYSLEDGVAQVIKWTDMSSSRRQRRENCVEKDEESGVYSEHWIHGDCSIWSAGVFLVKGKLYGLGEAIRLAQGIVCSHCHRVGATLGCFFKDCPNKYHFPCALQSDCVLSEENFTIRCSNHKNKSSRLSVSRLKNR
ncbi:uncharacterized protein si:ch211-165g14.1 [Triplophysa rosa]|uniref:PHD-type domain-containing protein n=1 Tax=Triplophysa rosa TaxID=992332 RepID=A0A9W7WL39_TRIRA|nr:uncharacterized protein si:ch211-165g14.1 [Triplophysa rosa]XP_057201873.1 uncharacterized protein si:ch211-165g14.1 [Triplophysa rosa]KAI7803145.1 hypothetical protein IRJ41_003355 [Triplophysa rosa]